MNTRRESYPPFNAGRDERAAWYASNPVPHEREPPYSCCCSACGKWREAQVRPGDVVLGIELDPSQSTGNGSNSWAPHEEFTWKDPIRVPSLVIGDAPPWCSGAHLRPVMLLVPGMGIRVSPKMWLLVLWRP